jgi:hypothetical protein
VNGVWAASPTDAFAVGPSGKAWRFTGSAWQSMSTGVSTSDGLFDVWGTSPSSVFAVGSNGIIIRFDGTSWRPMTSGVTSSLYGVWGTSATDVYAVGSGGAILHFDGRAWQQESGTGTVFLSGVHGLAGGGAIAIGGSPAAVRGRGPTGTFGLFGPAFPPSALSAPTSSVWAEMDPRSIPDVRDPRAVMRFAERLRSLGIPPHLMKR